jgi:hypothetical protein
MKLPFSFGLKFVFRLLFPGFILAIGISPILQTVLERVGIPHWNVIAFIILTIFLGWIIMVMDMPIYMAFEGRRYWPSPLWNYFREGEQRRLEKLWRKYEKAKNEGNRPEVVEVSVELRKFPINEDGEWYAMYPTRLGNLLTSFEEYSNRIYGMDSIFYWPRIWLTLDKHIQDDVDSQQALTDSTLYTTVALFTCGILSIIYALFVEFNQTWIDFLPNATTLVILSAGCFIAGYLTYRVSLHLFAQFGEIFKSLIDVYHGNIEVQDVLEEVYALTGDKDLLQAPDKYKYKVAWRYMHNYRIKLHEGGKSYTPEQLKKKIKHQEGDEDTTGTDRDAISLDEEDAI